MQIWCTTRWHLGELHGGDAGQALMFCFDNVSPEKSCFRRRFGPFSFTLPRSFCVPECYQRGVKSSTAVKVLFFSFTFTPEGKTDEGKEFTITKELFLKFVRFISGWKCKQ